MNTITERLKELEALNAARLQGDWAIQHSYYGHNIGPEEFTTVCCVRNGANDEEYGGKETELANAKFIAAAPAMIALAQDMHKLLVECGEALSGIGGSYMHPRAADRIDNALTKLKQAGIV